MKQKWYCLYKFDSNIKKFIKLKTQLVYTLDQNYQYAVKCKNVECYVVIKTKSNSLSQRDISLFKLGRNSIDLLTEETYETEILDF